MVQITNFRNDVVAYKTAREKNFLKGEIAICKTGNERSIFKWEGSIIRIETGCDPRVLVGEIIRLHELLDLGDAEHVATLERLNRRLSDKDRVIMQLRNEIRDKSAELKRAYEYYNQNKQEQGGGASIFARLGSFCRNLLRHKRRLVSFTGISG
jgi:hypothetical protein